MLRVDAVIFFVDSAASCCTVHTCVAKGVYMWRAAAGDAAPRFCWQGSQLEAVQVETGVECNGVFVSCGTAATAVYCMETHIQTFATNVFNILTMHAVCVERMHVMHCLTQDFGRLSSPRDMHVWVEGLISPHTKRCHNVKWSLGGSCNLEALRKSIKQQ